MSQPSGAHPYTGTLSALKAHPLAEIWPIFPDVLEEVTESIRENGLRQPVVLDVDGQIIDGRTRYAACEALGIEPETVVYEGADVLEYIRDANASRRHVSTGARAMIVAQMMVKDGRRKDGKWTQGSLSSEKSQNSKTMQTYMTRAGVILDWIPESAESVIAGTLNIDLAYQQAKDARNAVDAEKQRAAIEANRKREATIRERNLNTQRLEILTKENSPYLKQVEAGDMSIVAAHAAHLADTAREREEAAQAKRIAEQDARTLSEGMVAFQFLESPEARSRMLNHWNIAGAGVRPLALHATTPEHMRETATLLNQFATEWEKYQWHTNQS